MRLRQDKSDFIIHVAGFSVSKLEPLELYHLQKELQVTYLARVKKNIYEIARQQQEQDEPLGGFPKKSPAQESDVAGGTNGGTKRKTFAGKRAARRTRNNIARNKGDAVL
ncbi:unnamed protein product, partial [Amoebophrya sp. A120]|eukprot:GSA120T00016417001.1